MVEEYGIVNLPSDMKKSDSCVTRSYYRQSVAIIDKSFMIAILIGRERRVK